MTNEMQILLNNVQLDWLYDEYARIV